MARATYVLRAGELVEKHLAPPLHAARSAPMVRSDGMDPVQSMADGRMYDSKSAYERSVRAAGCEIVGNDPAFFRPRQEVPVPISGRDIKQAIEQLRSR